MRPTLGRIVHYRSHTGNYTLAAIVTATQETLWPEGVERGDVRPLRSETHVHLFVFSPSCVPSGGGLGAPPPGYEEYDVPFSAEGAPGSWLWPPRVKEPN